MKFLNSLKFREINKRIVSIDFGASFMKVAQMEARGNKFALLAYGLKECSLGQKSAKDLGADLRELLDANSIDTKEACFTIYDPDKIFIKKLTLPQIPKEELLNAVKWQLKNEFTFNPDESICDLQIIREYADSEAAKKIELFCIFAKRELINEYLSVAAAVGLAPFKISNSVFNYSGILNSLTATPALCAILDIGHTHSRILIYQNNKLNFVRNINFSASKLCESLVQVLVTDKGRVEIDLEKARQLIYRYGIILDESVKFQGQDIGASQIIPLMRPLLEILAKELERSFDFFNSESALGLPQILYITAGGANLKNLDNYLAGQLKIKVEKLPLPDSLEIKQIKTDQFYSDANQLSSAIGAVMSGSKINLLPPEVRSQKAELIQKSSLRIAAIAVGAVFIFSWFAVNFQIRDYKKRLKIAKLHLESTEEIKILKEAVDLRENYANKIHQGQIPPSGLLKLIGSVIPAGIILDEFDFDQLSHSMRLRGVVTVSKDSVEKVVTDFMNNLEDSKFVQEANLISSKDDRGINSFEVESKLVR